ncbi:MAG: DUF4131 domain-containing protein, partial [Armatimonadetes bacterium]|nr:DUF4131 domain-containing protein [Armatimonadota bacterium]NIM22788.1 DUF4131 domain-containing protein [Armatimonadota bacterium]NIM66655.1 DUF4131 domain-containing protein [Armatimonadota bacterium]NIM75207.1 DUF4131 domain-containing protein [Armatimonadota bacterium]NIN04848.1 DUF4131 domain-containing protein [Armatimonadota bacterium]
MTRADAKPNWLRRLGEEFWSRPLVLLAILYVLALKSVVEGKWTWAPLLAAGLAMVVAKGRSRPAFPAVALLMTLVLIWHHRQAGARPPVGEFIDKAVVLKGTVTQPPVPSSGGGLTLTLEAEEVVSRGKAVPAKGRVWVYVPREVSADYLDVLEIVGELRPTLFSDRRDAAWMALGDARLLRKVGEREEGFV